MSRQTDLAVVGAGPAGLTAATVAAEHGLRTLVLDEYPLPGGRLLGQLHEERPRGGRPQWWKGGEVARELAERALRAGVELCTGVQVWGLEPGWRVYLGGGPESTVRAPALLLATGAGERALPVPGWTLPGVLTVGAAQVFANVHRVRPGNRVLICGVDPLALTVARELTLAGATVLGIVLPPPGPLAGGRAVPASVVADLCRLAGMAPSPLLRLAGRAFRHAPALGASLYPPGGVRAWGVPLRLKTALLRITGSEAVAGAVLAGLDARGRLRPGSERAVAVDCVALSGGLAPVVELAAAAGCRLVPSGLGGLVPLHSPAMETELPGLLVAGNITGVEGARVAMAQGRIAGLTAAHRLGALPAAAYAAALATAQAALARTRAEAAIAFYPDASRSRQALARRWQESGDLTAD